MKTSSSTLENTPRKILMVTDTFFPKRVISAFRAGKFCKYLTEFGWQPTVLTLKDQYYGRNFDNSLLKGVESVPVIKTDMLGIEALKVLFISIKKMFSRQSRAKEKGLSLSVSSRNRKWISKFTLWTEPTEGLGWVPFGVLKGYNTARKSDIIWATSPIPGTLCLGAILSKLTGKPFIADLRDPWRSEADHPYPTRIHKAIDNFLLNFVFKNATKIIVVTDTMARDYRRQFPQYSDKIERIYNGYDEEDFQQFQSPVEHDAKKNIIIAYLGTLYSGREDYMRKLLLSLTKINFAVNGTNIKIYYRGPSLNIFNTIVKEHNCEAFCDAGGSVPYAEAMKAMREADILLLLGSPAHIYALPGKVFEHIGSKKPTLYAGPRGEAWDFICRYEIGECIDLCDKNSNSEDISVVLNKLISNYRYYVENLSRIGYQFTRYYATKCLVDVLNRIVTPKTK